MASIAHKCTLCVLPCDSWGACSMVMAMLQGSAKHMIEKVYCGVMNKHAPCVDMLKEFDQVHIFEYSQDHMGEVEKCMKQADSVILHPLHACYRDEKQQQQQQHGYEWMMKLWKQYLEMAQKAGVKCMCMKSIIHADKLEGSLVKHVHKMEQMFMQYVQPPSSSGPDHHHHHQQQQQEPQKQHHKMHGFVIRVAPPMECLFVFRKSIQQERELRLPIKQGKFCPVSMRDVAHGWMKLMEKYQKRSFDELHQSHKHGIMCFTGPELIRGPQLAEEASEALGTKIRFQHVSEDELCKYLKQTGELSREEIECFVEMMYNIEKGHLEEQTKDLEKLMGKKPMRLRDFFEHHEDEFKPSQ